MEYITHQRYKEKAACGERLNIPYGTKMNTIGEFIVTADNKPVCYCTSENAKIHFARNDDGRGLERGALTHAIAYGKRRAGNGYRFTEAEIAMLETEWGHFLRDDVETILFNNAFFDAEPEELRRLAGALKIKA